MKLRVTIWLFLSQPITSLHNSCIIFHPLQLRLYRILLWIRGWRVFAGMVLVVGHWRGCPWLADMWHSSAEGRKLETPTPTNPPNHPESSQRMLSFLIKSHYSTQCSPKHSVHPHWSGGCLTHLLQVNTLPANKSPQRYTSVIFVLFFPCNFFVRIIFVKFNKVLGRALDTLVTIWNAPHNQPGWK